MTSSLISFAYFTFFQTQISPELMNIFGNGKRRFYSFMEFYVMQLKYQGKILIIVPLSKMHIKRQEIYSPSIFSCWTIRALLQNNFKSTGNFRIKYVVGS